MSSKVQRKVTVENVKESSDGPRRPSVFDRLGPGAVTAQERHSRSNDPGEQCRNWMRNGACSYGTKCRYQHEAYPPSSSTTSSSRLPKTERDAAQKDLRHKVRHKQDAKESDSRSPSPKRRKASATSSGAGSTAASATGGGSAPSGSGSGGASSRSRRLEAESKIKSTVVVTRPRTPSSGEEEPAAKEAKPAKTWEGAASDVLGSGSGVPSGRPWQWRPPHCPHGSRCRCDAVLAHWEPHRRWVPPPYHPFPLRREGHYSGTGSHCHGMALSGARHASLAQGKRQPPALSLLQGVLTVSTGVAVAGKVLFPEREVTASDRT